MTSFSLRAASLLLAVAALSVETGASHRISTHVIINLGTLPGGESSSASDINYSRQVVGSSLVAGQFRPFLWQNHVMTELPLLPGAIGGGANSINDRGQIVGSNNMGWFSQAVLWDDGMVIDLGGLPGAFSCAAQAINNRGQIVGACDMSTGEPGGFLWENGRMISLGGLPGTVITFPTSINLRGQVVGLAIDAQSEAHAFAWQQGRLVDLGELPGGTGSFAGGINSHGDIVGWSQDAQFAPFAHLWTRGKMVNLGTLPGKLWSQAFAINLHRQITGRSEQTPFIWANGDMLALPTLQGGSGIGLSINNRGDIAGQADNANGQPRAVMWTERLRLLHEPGLVLDFGPDSGPLTPGEGLGAVLFSASNSQNFVDRVFFRRDTENHRPQRLHQQLPPAAPGHALPREDPPGRVGRARGAARRIRCRAHVRGLRGHVPDVGWTDDRCPSREAPLQSGPPGWGRDLLGGRVGVELRRGCVRRAGSG